MKAMPRMKMMPIQPVEGINIPHTPISDEDIAFFINTGIAAEPLPMCGPTATDV
jgi:hypothetical protein